MFILKINATGSTNTFLKEFLIENGSQHACVVIAEHQTSGRGQVGKTWISQAGKSLTFSVYKPFKWELCQAFYILMAVSLAIKKTLTDLGVPEVMVKWPNDILSAGKKICGILIENLSQGGHIHGIIIGIGLNVNEQSLPGLPQATSMFLSTQKKYDRDQVVDGVLQALDRELERLQQTTEEVKANYLEHLYKRNVPGVFETAQAGNFIGVIRDISTTGKLIVEDPQGLYEEYDLQQIKMQL